MSFHDLQTTLLGLPPLELGGVQLLRERRGAGFFPTNVPRADLRAAVTEIVAYTTSCQAAARRVAQLTAVPASVGLPAFAL